MSEDRQLVFEVSSVEEALSAASRRWGVPEEELRAEVIGSDKGFLGLFGKKLKVKVRPVEQPPVEASLLHRGRDCWPGGDTTGATRRVCPQYPPRSRHAWG